MASVKDRTLRRGGAAGLPGDGVAWLYFGRPRGAALPTAARSLLMVPKSPTLARRVAEAERILVGPPPCGGPPRNNRRFAFTARGSHSERQLTPPLNSTNPIDLALAQAGERAGSFVSRHVTSRPRQLTAVVTLALAGFGATAFGLAPLAPDAANLPTRVVSEALQPTGIDTQLEALARQPLSLYRSDVTRASDTADSLLRRVGVSDRAAATFLRTNPVARALLAGRGGKMLQVSASASGELEELIARFPADDPQRIATHFTRLRVSRVAGQLVAERVQAPLAVQVRLGSGTIHNSLFAATDEARIPDKVASQLADIFAADIDFHRALRRGDTFSVLYEAMTADGEPVTWGQTAGRVLAAEFVNDGETHSALWYAAMPDAKGTYYGFDGKSKKGSFLASPLEFSRVTSGFAMRFHPILQRWRQHAGVDFGAPNGTPVRSVGDGVVEFAGRQSGYGNVVTIQHSGEQSTVYAHLSRIDVRRGERVEQGELIGAVGATGWATGPHLHFEFKQKGEQVDPLQMAHAAGNQPLAGAALARFVTLARTARSQLDAAESAAGDGSYAE